VRNTLLASCLLLVGVAATAFAQGPAPSCEISGPTKVFVGEPFELCGIEGEGLTYTWADGDDNVINHDRCLSFPAGLPAPGFYDFEFTISQGEDFLKCPVTIEVNEREELECEIEAEIECGEAELCGPDGFEYLWSGPGVEGETTQCVTVDESGTYTLTVTVPGTKETCKDEIEIELKPCGENCPRTVGFWGLQADQLGNGSTKFSKAQVTAIAECISDAVDVFDWGTGDAAFDAFDAVINPSNPMTCEKQIKRQLAGLLANICATGVDPALWDGDVSLDPSTEVTCGGEDMTIAELIDLVDDELTSGSPDYCLYISCVDDINNGIGIPLDEDCRAEELKEDTMQRLGGSPLPAAGSLLPTELSFSATNPASLASLLRFSLPADGDVSVKIFDVAGRQVANLGGGFMPAGSYTMEWNVRGVARGLYFARLAVNGQVRTQQIVVSQ
jgi:hypothetical protein